MTGLLERYEQLAGISNTWSGGESPGTAWGSPVGGERGLVSSGFGTRDRPSTARGRGSREHGGFDIVGWDRSDTDALPATAASSGTVVEAGWTSGLGRAVTVEHPDGTSTVYGHLDSIGVQPGQHVDMGQPLGSVGSTGNSSADHLHFEMRDASGRPINPTGAGYGADPLDIGRKGYAAFTSPMEDTYRDIRFAVDHSLPGFQPDQPGVPAIPGFSVGGYPASAFGGVVTPEQVASNGPFGAPPEQAIAATQPVGISALGAAQTGQPRSAWSVAAQAATTGAAPPAGMAWEFDPVVPGSLATPEQMQQTYGQRAAQVSQPVGISAPAPAPSPAPQRVGDAFGLFGQPAQTQPVGISALDAPAPAPAPAGISGLYGQATPLGQVQAPDQYGTGLLGAPEAAPTAASSIYGQATPTGVQAPDPLGVSGLLSAPPAAPTAAASIYGQATPAGVQAPDPLGVPGLLGAAPAGAPTAVDATQAALDQQSQQLAAGPMAPAAPAAPVAPERFDAAFDQFGGPPAPAAPAPPSPTAVPDATPRMDDMFGRFESFPSGGPLGARTAGEEISVPGDLAWEATHPVAAPQSPLAAPSPAPAPAALPSIDAPSMGIAGPAATPAAMPAASPLTSPAAMPAATNIGIGSLTAPSPDPAMAGISSLMSRVSALDAVPALDLTSRMQAGSMGLTAPPGASIGRSSFGGFTSVYDKAPDRVAAAASGPGLVGAMARDFGGLPGLSGLSGRGAAIGGLAGLAAAGPVGGLAGAGIGGLAGGLARTGSTPISGGIFGGLFDGLRDFFGGGSGGGVSSTGTAGTSSSSVGGGWGSGSGGARSFAEHEPMGGRVY